ncbi:unnamed protein product [Arctogadus glacialis]
MSHGITSWPTSITATPLLSLQLISDVVQLHLYATPSLLLLIGLTLLALESLLKEAVEGCHVHRPGVLCGILCHWNTSLGSICFLIFFLLWLRHTPASQMNCPGTENKALVPMRHAFPMDQFAGRTGRRVVDM